MFPDGQPQLCKSILIVTLHVYIDCCFGINSAVDGSAYLEYGNIKVICDVTGPIEVNFLHFYSAR